MSGSEKQPTLRARHPLLVLEDALVLCQFGRFHMKLILACVMTSFASSMVIITSSYLLPNAECDLDMSMTKKGLLNGAPFFGIAFGSLLSSFFVDAFGRKIFLVGGQAAIFIFTVLEASTQSYWSLLLMKVLEGASSILNLVAMFTLVVEITRKDVRNRFAMFMVSLLPLVRIVGALISWGILPHQEWHFVVWKGHFELHARNIYVYICSMFSLFATMLWYILPESPKYLLFQGKEDEALDILRRVYSENTGQAIDTFPIKTIGSLRILKAVTIKKWIKIYLGKLEKLFQKPLVCHMMLFSCILFASHMIQATILLWYPQISTIIENYRKEHGNTEQLCTMLNQYIDKINTTVSEVCVPSPTGPETYINTIIVSLISFLATNVTGYLVDYFGQKLLMFALFILSAVCTGALYLVSSSHQIVLLISVICGFLQATSGLQKTKVANLFPTTSRALGLSFVIMWCKAGGLSGNIIFPILLQIDCMVPFIAFSIVLLCTSFLVYFIPNKGHDATVKIK